MSTSQTTSKGPLSTTTTTTTTAANQGSDVNKQSHVQQTQDIEPAIGLSGGAVSEGQTATKTTTQSSDPLGGMKNKMNELMESLKPEPVVEYPVGLSGGAVEGTAQQQAAREREIERKKWEQQQQQQQSGILGSTTSTTTSALNPFANQSQNQEKEYGTGLSGGAVEGGSSSSSSSSQQSKQFQGSSTVPVVAEIRTIPVQVQQEYPQSSTSTPSVSQPFQSSTSTSTSTSAQPGSANFSYMEAKGVGSQARDFVPSTQDSQSQLQPDFVIPSVQVGNVEATSVVFPTQSDVSSSQSNQSQGYSYEQSQGPSYTGYGSQAVYGTAGGYVAPPTGYSVSGGYGTGLSSQTESYGAPLGGLGVSQQQTPQSEIKSQSQNEPSSLRREGLGSDTSYLSGRRA